MPETEGLGWLPDLPPNWRIRDPRPQDIDYINRRWRAIQENTQNEPINRGEIEAETDRVITITNAELIAIQRKLNKIEDQYRIDRCILIGLLFGIGCILTVIFFKLYYR